MTDGEPLSIGEDEVKVWRCRLVQSYRAKRDKVTRWRRIRDCYKGEYYRTLSRTDRVAVNWILATVRQMMAALYYQNPTMYFTPRSRLGEIAAPIMEGATQYERIVMDAGLHERRALQNALLYGRGVLKHGYNAEYSLSDPWRGRRPEGAEKDETPLPKGLLTEYKPGFVSEHPWVKSVSPFKFHMDPTAVYWDEARWFAEEYERPYADVIQDERFDPAARKEVRPSGQSPFFPDEMVERKQDWSDSPETVDAALVSCFEIFDVTTQTVITITDSTMRPLEVRPYKYFGPMGPYEQIQFYEIDDDAWPQGHAESYQPQVEVLNNLRTKMMNHLAAWSKTKLGYKVGSIMPEDVQRFNRGDEGFYQVNANDNIDKLFAEMPRPPMASDAWRLTDMFYDDMQRVSGISDLAMGVQAPSGTATEASYQQQEKGLRTTDMRAALDRLLTRSTRRIVSLLRQFWGPERMVPLVGPEGQVWEVVRVTKDLVEAEYDVAIEPGSTEKVDKHIRSRQVLETIDRLLQMQPLLQEQGYAVNWPEIVKTMLRNTDVFRNPEKALVRLLPANPTSPTQPQPAGSGTTPTSGPGTPAAPTPINNMGQAPWATGTAVRGREFSRGLS